MTELRGKDLSGITLDDITPGLNSKLTALETVAFSEISKDMLTAMLVRERLTVFQREAEIKALIDPLPRDKKIDAMQARINESDDNWEQLDQIFGLKNNGDDMQTIKYAASLQASFEFYTAILKKYVDAYGSSILEEMSNG